LSRNRLLEAGPLGLFTADESIDRKNVLPTVVAFQAQSALEYDRTPRKSGAPFELNLKLDGEAFVGEGLFLELAEHFSAVGGGAGD
jgi:hypothetical protein